MDKEIQKRLIEKATSGRFLTFMLITATLCYAVIQSVNAVLNIGNNENKEIIEKVSMFILGAFVSITTSIFKEYWDQARAGINRRQTDKPEETK